MEVELMKETARLKEQAITDERERLKKELLERGKQKQLEEEERERQKKMEQEAQIRELERQKELALAEERERRAAEAREPLTLMPAAADPPCELPIWCVMPRRQDIVNDVELVRLSSATSEA